ncbi:MAG: RNase adapter RapZ [Xanthomonadales bacterium]|nr:RNase adapter RapZ [Xanthomonadales bacterium]NNL96250.1 RNase adapter RapZ [Xanthomonadales bacterium]
MADSEQHLIIVSGLSGGGKSTALNALEDLGYYCIDNVPAALLDQLASHLDSDSDLYARVALGIDARARGAGLETLPDWLRTQKEAGAACGLLFLSADRDTLLKRFSETRRRHPLTRGDIVLADAIDEELAMLEPIRKCADWVIDSTETNIHQLRRQVWNCVGPGIKGMTVVLESFGFKKGVPRDVDFVFDARNLPNPYWQAELREFSGRDAEVREWLEQDVSVTRMTADILEFLRRWLPGFEAAQRSYVTVGIGCTGGRHRSVYLVEKLAQALREDFPEVLVDHRELKV